MELTFDLFVAVLRFAVVTDDAGVLAVATVVRAGRLFDAVRQRSLVAAALDVVHVDGPRPFPKVRHHSSLRHTAGERGRNLQVTLLDRLNDSNYCDQRQRIFC